MPGELRKPGGAKGRAGEGVPRVGKGAARRAGTGTGATIGGDGAGCPLRVKDGEANIKEREGQETDGRPKRCFKLRGGAAPPSA